MRGQPPAPSSCAPADTLPQARKMTPGWRSYLQRSGRCASPTGPDRARQSLCPDGPLTLSATGTSSPTSASKKSASPGKTTRRRVEYTCRVCERQFYDVSVGVAHWREHFGLTECSSCGHVMPETRFRSHRTKIHEPKPFRCQWCSFRASTQGVLTEHQKVAHLGPWYRCSRCLVVIRRWSHFVDHAREGICAGLNPG